MTTIVKFTIAIVFSLLLTSCNFDGNWGIGVKGNGNVITAKRQLDANFTQIEASRGLEVYITQAETTSLLIEADENLHDLITTSVENGILKISATQNIGTATSKKIRVSAKNLDLIAASSGSNIHSTNTIMTEHLKLSSSSGADLEVNVEVTKLECTSSSGSDLKVSGKTDHLRAKASSGSDIKAGDLLAMTCDANASSGAEITINTIKKINATSSSGGDVTNLGTSKD